MERTGRRLAAVVGTAVGLAPVVFLLQYLAVVAFIGYHLDYAATDGWDSFRCFRAVVFVEAPKHCAEGFASPSPLEAGAAAAVSALLGAAAIVAVRAVSGPWKDRKFEVEASVRAVTWVVVVVIALWTLASSFGLFFADALAV